MILNIPGDEDSVLTDEPGRITLHTFSLDDPSRYATPRKSSLDSAA
jgi:hypothetical protein